MLNGDYYIVDSSILPEYIPKVIQTREIMETKGLSVVEACKITGISRSTFYKYDLKAYKMDSGEQRRAIFTFKTDDIPGVLSNLITKLYSFGANVLSINQNEPIGRIAYITVVIDVKNVSESMAHLQTDLKDIDGVRDVILAGIE